MKLSGTNAGVDDLWCLADVVGRCFPPWRLVSQPSLPETLNPQEEDVLWPLLVSTAVRARAQQDAAFCEENRFSGKPEEVKTMSDINYFNA